jgi:hypothetical protein
VPTRAQANADGSISFSGHRLSVLEHDVENATADLACADGHNAEFLHKLEIMSTGIFQAWTSLRGPDYLHLLSFKQATADFKRVREALELTVAAKQAALVAFKKKHQL